MNSIRRQLLTTLLAGLALALGGAGVAVFHRTRAVLTREFDVALRAKAAVLAADTEYDEDGKLELDVAGLNLPEFERDEFFQLWLPDGQTIARSPSLGFDDLPPRAGDLRLPDGRAGRGVLTTYVPLPAEDDQPVRSDIPAVTLLVARDRTALDRTLAGIGGGMALVGAVVLAATALLVTTAVRRGLAPLDAVGQQAATIDGASLQTRFATDALPAELRPIADRLNDLLARLDDAFQRERRVTADIAHELRTPIAELRALAEVGLKWPADASYRDALEIAQRMETLVTGLLALARHDAGHPAAPREAVALDPLVNEIWQPLAARARTRQLAVAIEVAGTWQTDPTLLRLIVANVLANAVEYTPECGQVCIAGNATQLAVSNSTNQLAPADLPQLFERFWRKDAARGDAGHSGLGLAVAQSAALALGLQLAADMPDPATLRVTLRGGG
jgi:two-component system sensor histidine kinase QseC